MEHNAAELRERLAHYALPDEVMGEAYEALGDRGRAVFKLCIARLHRLWGELAPGEISDRRLAPDFRVVTEELPVDFALFVCEASYRHPAALLAGVMPAILAGVEELFPCFVSGNEGELPRPELLAAMELAGVERCFSLPADDSAEFARWLREAAAGGCLVVFGQRSFGGDYALAAHHSGLACCSFTSAPVFTCLGDGRLMRQGFENLLPGNAPLPQESGAGEGRSGGALQLDEEHADVWVWPDLSPAWFRRRGMRLTC